MAEVLTHFFWLCMDKVTFVLSNSMLTLWGTNWWNFSTASVWINSVASHPESKQGFKLWCYKLTLIILGIIWCTFKVFVRCLSLHTIHLHKNMFRFLTITSEKLQAQKQFKKSFFFLMFSYFWRNKIKVFQKNNSVIDITGTYFKPGANLSPISTDLLWQIRDHIVCLFTWWALDASLRRRGQQEWTKKQSLVQLRHEWPHT